MAKAWLHQCFKCLAHWESIWSKNRKLSWTTVYSVNAKWTGPVGAAEIKWAFIVVFYTIVYWYKKKIELEKK